MMQTMVKYTKGKMLPAHFKLTDELLDEILIASDSVGFSDKRILATKIEERIHIYDQAVRRQKHGPTLTELKAYLKSVKAKAGEFKSMLEEEEEDYYSNALKNCVYLLLRDEKGDLDADFNAVFWKLDEQIDIIIRSIDYYFDMKGQEAELRGYLMDGRAMAYDPLTAFVSTLLFIWRDDLGKDLFPGRGRKKTGVGLRPFVQACLRVVGVDMSDDEANNKISNVRNKIIKHEREAAQKVPQA